MSGRRLSVVNPGQELQGGAPAAFEKLARTAEPGSAAHRGLVMICATLAHRSVTTCVPPSAQVDLAAGLETAFLWIKGQASAGDARSARATCFQSVTAIEALTDKAVAGARAAMRPSSDTPLDAHADHVVSRYAKLAAHFTVSGVCHALDAIETPEAALEVLSDAQGARAYQATGLGSARHPAFRKAAWGQAQWEAAKDGESNAGPLAVQVFHEYLGGRWRNHADAERLKNEDFIAWALRGQLH